MQWVSQMNKGFLISSCIAIILLNTTISAAILPRLKTEGVTTIQSAIDNASDGAIIYKICPYRKI